MTTTTATAETVTVAEIREAAFDAIRTAARIEEHAIEYGASPDTVEVVARASAAMTVAEAGNLDEAVRLVRLAQDAYMRASDVVVEAAARAKGWTLTGESFAG